jgi:hypothetical protein
MVVKNIIIKVVENALATILTVCYIDFSSSNADPATNRGI